MKKYFTKQQYQLISYSGNITKDEAIQAGFSTAKEAKEARLYIRGLREERKELQEEYTTNTPNAYDKYLELRGKQIFDIMDRPAHYDVNYRFGDSFNFKADYYYDWDIYAKSYSHPAKVHIYTITIPRTGLMIQDFDGIETTYTKSRTIGEITLLTGGHMLTLGRGRMNLNVVPITVALAQAEYNEVTQEWDYTEAAHGQNAEQALNALRKKIGRAQKAENFKLTLDTKISAHMYQELTGACTEGTNAWLQSHGLNRKTRMTVQKLLTLLSPSDYGYRKIINMLEDSEIEFLHS